MALRSAIEMYGKLLPPNDYYDIDKICGDPSILCHCPVDYDCTLIEHWTSVIFDVEVILGCDLDSEAKVGHPCHLEVNAAISCTDGVFHVKISTIQVRNH